MKFIIWVMCVLGLVGYQYYFYDNLGFVDLRILDRSFSCNLIGLAVLLWVASCGVRLLHNLIGIPLFIKNYFSNKKRYKQKELLEDLIVAYMLSDMRSLQECALSLQNSSYKNIANFLLSERQLSISENCKINSSCNMFISDGDRKILALIMEIKYYLCQRLWQRAYDALFSMDDIYPDAQWVKYNLYLCAYKLEKWHEAQALLEDIYNKNMMDEDIFKKNLSQVMYKSVRTEDVEKSYKICKKAIELDKGNFPASIKAAELAVMLDKPHKARGIIETAWVQCPAFAYAYKLAQIYVNTFKISSEVEKLDHFNKLQSPVDDCQAHQQVAAVLATQAQLYPQALEILGLISVKGELEYACLAYIYAQRNQKDESLKALQELIRISSLAMDPKLRNADEYENLLSNNHTFF